MQRLPLLRAWRPWRQIRIEIITQNQRIMPRDSLMHEFLKKRIKAFHFQTVECMRRTQGFAPRVLQVRVRPVLLQLQIKPRPKPKPAIL